MKTKTLSLLSACAFGLLLVAGSGCAHNQPAAKPEPPTAAPAPAPEPQPEFVYLTAENLEAEVVNSPLPVLLYICDNDRGACKLEEPILRKVAVEYQGKVKFARVDMTDQKELGVALGVTSRQDLPLHIFVKDGKPVGSYAGFLDADELKTVLNKLTKLSAAPNGPTAQL